MNDHDWLDEELRNLPDLTARKPASSNNEAVQERAAQPIWIRFWRNIGPDPQFKHGLSMALLILLFWLNPPVVFFNGRLVSALSSYGRDPGYRRNDSQFGSSFSNTLWLVILALQWRVMASVS